MFEAAIFGWRRTQEAGDQDSEARANFCGKAATINIGLGMNLPGIGHFTLMSTMVDNRLASPYAASRTAKPVNFYCAAPSAQFVYLVGDFNGWNPTSHPMLRRVDGWWFIEVQLTHGHHRYRFLVDGQPMLDPQGTGIARNERNERVSLLSVS